MTTTSPIAALPASSLISDLPDSSDCKQQTAGRFSGFLPVFLTVLQFGLLVLVIQVFELEGPAFAALALLALVGFPIHHYLPRTYRLPFFSALSIGGTILVVGPQTAAWVMGMGLAIIAVCHVPVKMSLRILLLSALGIVLAWMRLQVPATVIPASVWPTLGAMFMFRVIIYLYDLKHAAAPFSMSRSLGYFFMLPNVCFPLFPIIDYKTYCTTHYNTEPTHIYRTGLQWMLRGILQLLAYRVVYHHLLIHPLEATDLSGVVRFCIATFFLYLRVSGQFHVIIGLLHLFGFNLPETHHLYFLSSSFTDFWRRINIYWKDFITKLFFYPTYFRVRHWKTSRAITLATLVAFFATWLLHTYQTFWLLGDYKLRWQDTVFWWALAGLVLFNALREARRGRRRILANSKPSLGSEAVRVLCTVGTFFTICFLWTIWNCESAAELYSLAKAVTHVNGWGILSLLGVVLVVAISSYFFGRSVAQRTEDASTRRHKTPSGAVPAIALVGICSILLAARAMPARFIPASGAQRMLAMVFREQLNERDANRQQRGYYETITSSRAASSLKLQVPEAVFGVQLSSWRDKLYHKRSDFLMRELTPETTTTMETATVTTNRWGMRDRDYQKTKPDGKYRIAVLGSSVEMGWGVEDHETFEHLLEERLNRERNSEYQVLNFSVGAYGAFQKLVAFESKALGFQPNAAIFVTYGAELERTASHLGKVVSSGVEIPQHYEDVINSILRKANINRQTPYEHIPVLMKAHMPELMLFVFSDFKRVCERHGVQPIIAYRPVADEFMKNPKLREQIVQAAELANVTFLDLSNAFNGYEPNQIVLSATDYHFNPLGHRLIADSLYEQLVDSDDRLLRN